MFTLHFTNHPDNGPRQFHTLKDALSYGKRTCFEFSVWRNGRRLASWSPIGGLRGLEQNAA